jgi:hypothetical protein
MKIIHVISFLDGIVATPTIKPAEANNHKQGDVTQTNPEVLFSSYLLPQPHQVSFRSHFCETTAVIFTSLISTDPRFLFIVHTVTAGLMLHPTFTTRNTVLSDRDRFTYSVTTTAQLKHDISLRDYSVVFGCSFEQTESARFCGK